ncbi:MAG: Uma2 family endonuclease [Deltaproteobacteria bacterium]|nr:MAG: Uma2 family endonuclease [Deltaproteobacteria bacterium]
MATRTTSIWPTSATAGGSTSTTAAISLQSWVGRRGTTLWHCGSARRSRILESPVASPSSRIKIEGDPADATGDTITNPTLIIEVLSPTTEQYDRGEKWEHFQRIPSLQEYVLVSQSKPRVERYRRLATGGWEYDVATEGTVQLVSGAVIDLAKLYADLPA